MLTEDELAAIEKWLNPIEKGGKDMPYLRRPEALQLCAEVRRLQAVVWAARDDRLIAPPEDRAGAVKDDGLASVPYGGVYMPIGMYNVRHAPEDKAGGPPLESRGTGV